MGWAGGLGGERYEYCNVTLVALYITIEDQNTVIYMLRQKKSWRK